MAPLFGSFNSLRVHGLSGFQYAELAFLAALPFVLSYGFFMDNMRDVRDSLPKGYIGKYSFVMNLLVLLFFPFFWQFIALGIYASLNNFSSSAQFVTNCTQIPVTSWQTIVQCYSLADDSYQCYLGSKNAWIIGLFIRVIATVFSFLLIGGIDGLKEELPMPTTEIELVPAEQSNITEEPLPLEEEIENASVPRNHLRRELGFFDSLSLEKFLGNKENSAVKFCIAFITIFYVISIGFIQWKGLDTTGLEVCDVNEKLLTSKSGYIKDWYNQELTSLKQLTLV